MNIIQLFDLIDYYDNLLIDIVYNKLSMNNNINNNINTTYIIYYTRPYFNNIINSVEPYFIEYNKYNCYPTIRDFEILLINLIDHIITIMNYNMIHNKTNIFDDINFIHKNAIINDIKNMLIQIFN
jgi:hypothetical protein